VNGSFVVVLAPLKLAQEPCEGFSATDMSASIEQRNQDATLWCGNLDEKVEEELLWELMLQAGPVVSLHMPKDKVRSKSEFSAKSDAVFGQCIASVMF
jgi:RNA recognition motif-containing protein